MYTCFWWQWFAGAVNKPPLATRASPPPMPDVHESLCSLRSFETAGRIACQSRTPLDPAFEMHASLSAAFGNKTFNVVAYEDGNPANSVVLMAVTVADGRVAEYDTETCLDPDFELLVSQTAMFGSLECPLSVFSFQNDGIEILNFSTTPADVLFRGSAVLLFGATEDCETWNGCTCAHLPVPAVSEWALLIMALLLLTGAKVRFGRRAHRSETVC